MNNIELNKL